MRKITRREAVRAEAASGLVIATTDVAAVTEALAAATRRGGAARPAGTTLAQTILRGPVTGPGGYRVLAAGAGEPLTVRTDLGLAAQPGRRARRRALLAFAHLTDIHVVDAQSPARVEFTDRLAGPFTAAFRAHESLTAQVSDSIVQAINRVGTGPITGRRLAFAICTGDNVDNTQHNEVRWAIDVLDGERVPRPDSGDITRWEGVQDSTAANYDAAYYHPDGTPPGTSAGDDTYRKTFGFPVIRGLLDAARRPFRAEGLNVPWLTAYGNHDGLVQGNFPKKPEFDAIATGSRKVGRIPASLSPASVLVAQLGGSFDGVPTRTVTADAARRLLTRSETIAEHFNTSGTPRGHGYTRRNLRTGTAYYTFEHGLVFGIVLDTVNPNGGNDGSMDEAQLAWLERKLMRHSRRYLDAQGNVVRHAARDRLVVLFSHHTIGSMSNGATGPQAPGRRVLGAEVAALLLRFPNVIAWVNGHTHRNQVFAHPRLVGGQPSGGFWELNTASHIDFPQQARLVEVADNRDGTLSIFGTIIDAAGPLRWNGSLAGPGQLAALSRELAVNDPQERVDGPALPGTTVDGKRGAASDRNVELLVPRPF